MDIEIVGGGSSGSNVALPPAPAPAPPAPPKTVTHTRHHTKTLPGVVVTPTTNPGAVPFANNVLVYTVEKFVTVTRTVAPGP